jgi:predicted nucleotidyltransferase
MNILYPQHRIFLEVLLKNNVDFILIGGYAVNYYGYNRVTGDMDIWIKPDNNNKELLLDALNALDFDEEGIAIIRSWDFTKPQKFHIGNEKQPDKTEFMTHISGVKYGEAASNKTIAMIDGLKLPIIHYNNLIQNKAATGRIKDKADIEYLEKITYLKNKKL